MILAITTITEKVITSIPLVMGIIVCLWLLFSKKGKSHYRPSLKLSELEDSSSLSDNDYLLMTDTSERKSVKITLGKLKEFLK